MPFLCRKQRERQGYGKCNSKVCQPLRIWGLDSWLAELQSLQKARDASVKMNGRPLTSMLWAAKLQTDLASLLRSPAEYEHRMWQQALTSLELALALNKIIICLFFGQLRPPGELCCCVCILPIFCITEESRSWISGCLEVLKNGGGMGWVEQKY